MVGSQSSVPVSILRAFGIPEGVPIQSFGSGHINRTFKSDDGDVSFVLQRVNHHVFRKPEIIAANIRLASEHLKKNHPDYLFLSPIPSQSGLDLVYDEEGYPWRLMPYFKNSLTINEVSTPQEAYEAARGFAQLTKNLSGCDVGKFKPTIDRFHDLNWRFEQFQDALAGAKPDRLERAAEAIRACQDFSYLVDEYSNLIADGFLKLRVMHNDTKINNILFDAQSRKVICVIDLDTLMPGYFIYDLGDMVRTFVSPVSEEEQDLAKIIFRKDIYDAMLQGYLSEMKSELSEKEMQTVPFAGCMMTYIMALRFLADYLKGDVYYTTTYEGQNLNRAFNQLKLVEILRKNSR